MQSSNIFNTKLYNEKVQNKFIISLYVCVMFQYKKADMKYFLFVVEGNWISKLSRNLTHVL